MEVVGTSFLQSSSVNQPAKGAIGLYRIPMQKIMKTQERQLTPRFSETRPSGTLAGVKNGPGPVQIAELMSKTTKIGPRL